MPEDIENLTKELEEKEEQAKKILEILNYAIESGAKVELLVFNPPNYSKSTSSTAVVTPERIENGCLQVKTEHKTNVSIDLSRIKRVIVWPSLNKNDNNADDTTIIQKL